MPPRRENPRRDNVNIGAAELAQLIAQAVTQALQQAAQNQGNPGNNEEQQNQPDALAWFDRFVKQKPDSFHSAPQPIDAENWIGHLEKIFDALGCDDATKVRLAVYKLEGDAQRWWRGVKTIRGDAFVEALTWQGFTDLFYEQYFSKEEKDGYMREFNSIEQKHDESITEYLARFIRLAGFAGTSAGTAEQQAEKFKWGLKSSLRMSIISSRFQNVAEVADAAKDVEKERIDFRTNRSNSGRKRGGDDQLVPAQVDMGMMVRTVGMDSGVDKTRIGEVIQLMVRDRISIVVRDKLSRGRLSSFSSSLDSGRIVKGDRDRDVIQRMGAATNPGTVSGTVFVGTRDAYVLFDTGSTRSVVSLSYVRYLGVLPSLLSPHMSIATPMRTSVSISDVYRECLIVVGDRNYKVNLLLMMMHDFDIILGMDWLSEYRETINCEEKRVIFGDVNKPEYVYQRSQPKGEVKLISAPKAKKLLSKGCDGYLAFVRDTSKVESRIEDYAVVSEYADVFPDELPGLPPHREVEFSIELVPGAEPIS
ncbi:uncharacterized protein LOC108207432 [Daucus carota subsp. sativus]|uniref:uncharacterized protein LOC108207432 n=1 Tax=Daucus carota subsp. sativus TaxID=79200 RepID=UPI003082BD89